MNAIKLFIPKELLSQEFISHFNSGSLSNRIVIDYATNNLIGSSRDNTQVEIEIFNFDNYMKLDNRYTTYEISVVKHSQFVLAGISIEIYKTI